MRQRRGIPDEDGDDVHQGGDEVVPHHPLRRQGAQRGRRVHQHQRQQRQRRHFERNGGQRQLVRHAPQPQHLEAGPGGQLLLTIPKNFCFLYKNMHTKELQASHNQYKA